MTTSRPSVAYVVPSLSAGDTSHMAHLPRFLEALAGHCAVHVVIERAAGVPHIAGAARVVVLPGGGRLRRAAALVRHARALRRLGCRDVFVRISVSAGLTLGAVGRLLGLRVHYWQSGQSHHLVPSWEAPVTRARFEGQIALQRLVMRLAWRVVTGPERMAAHYVRHFGVPPERLTILYNDVDVDALRARAAATSPRAARARLGLPAEDPVVLFVGRVSPLKGAYHLAPLADALAARAPNARLLVVGATSHASDAAAELARRPNVRLDGARANAALADYFVAADVFVLPSESEGFPRVVAEAMAYGVPVAAFDVGGVRDLLPEGQQAFVVPRGDVGRLADAVAALLADAEGCQALVAESARQVERFTPERVAAMFADRILGVPAAAAEGGR